MKEAQPLRVDEMVFSAVSVTGRISVDAMHIYVGEKVTFDRNSLEKYINLSMKMPM